MYTIIPIYNERMPVTYLFEDAEEAARKAKEDFSSPYAPETKGYMIVSIERVMKIKREIDDTVSLEDFFSDDTPKQCSTEETTAVEEVTKNVE